MIGPGVGPPFCGGAPLPFPGASYGSDFRTGQHQLNGAVYSAPTSLPGWTFTRASTGYAETAAGALVAFASGAPRITDKGLLVEEARSNLLLRSQEFDNASWSKGGTSISANAVNAPDGTLTADTLVENSASAQHQQFQGVVLTAASYTWSVYVKQAPGSQRWLSLYPQGTGVNAFAIFDLALGTVTFTGLAQYLSSSITAVAGGWYRCSITFTAAAVTVNCVSYLSNANNANAPTYLGDGASGLYFWGSQVELGSFPTSYIPTTTASATRAADVASISGLSVSAPYTIIGKYNIPSAAASSRGMFELDDGTANNSTAHYSSASTPVALCREATVNTAVLASSAQANLTPYIFGARWAVNDAKAYLNGTAMGADTALSPTAVSRLQIGAAAVLGAASNSYHERIVIYPTAFTDAQLQAATA